MDIAEMLHFYLANGDDSCRVMILFVCFLVQLW